MISLVVVNYRSAALAAEAVRSARAACSEPIQVVLVDNSCDPAEAAALRECADALLVPESNRGYAGGINDGRRACEGSTIVVSNPDVVFAPGSLDRLAGALDGKTAAAGPALYWDDAHEWMLPPGDVNRASGKVDEILASRSAAWHAARDRRRIGRRVAFWSLRETTAVDTLSGAVMAVRAADFDMAGGFDERFALYFEETDFVRRLRALRRRVVCVPDARCRHLFNQSAGRDAAVAAQRYAESERRYMEKWNGPFVARVLARLGRPPRADEAEPLAGPIDLDRDGVLVEASPLPGFGTAAGCFPSGRRVSVPREILESLRGAPLYLRVIDRTTREVLATRVMGR